MGPWRMYINTLRGLASSRIFQNSVPVLPKQEIWNICLCASFPSFKNQSERDHGQHPRHGIEIDMRKTGFLLPLQNHSSPLHADLKRTFLTSYEHCAGAWRVYINTILPPLFSSFIQHFFLQDSKSRLLRLDGCPCFSLSIGNNVRFLLMTTLAALENTAIHTYESAAVSVTTRPRTIRCLFFPTLLDYNNKCREPFWMFLPPPHSSYRYPKASEDMAMTFSSLVPKLV